jgi:poly(A) polymerase
MDLAPVQSVVDAFAAAHVPLYVVGGPVRDDLAGLPVKDFDFTTPARPDEIKALVDTLGPVFDPGLRFGTIGVVVAGVTCEITTYRVEAYAPESRKPEVSFTDNLTEDLFRRDFTVNAMAIDTLTGALHDPFGGQVDLRNRVLRTPSDPVTTFRDDPLRIIRLVRFAATRDMTIDPATFDGARATVPDIAKVAIERRTVELTRLLDEPRSDAWARAVAVATDIGCAAELFGKGVDVARLGQTAARGAVASDIHRHRLALLVDAGVNLSSLRVPNNDAYAARRLVRLVRDAATVTTIVDVRTLVRAHTDDELVDAIALAHDLDVDVNAYGGGLVALALAHDPTRRKAPLDGNDVRALGFEGRAIGDAVSELERMMSVDPRISADEASAALTRSRARARNE